MSDTGHGWVVPRDDGMKARCGGPALCPECKRDQQSILASQVDPLLQSDSDQSWLKWFSAQHSVTRAVEKLLDEAGDGKSDAFMAALTSSVIEHLAERQRRYIKLPARDAEDVT
jgi:hypothetical protein